MNISPINNVNYNNSKPNFKAKFNIDSDVMYIIGKRQSLSKKPFPEQYAETKNFIDKIKTALSNVEPLEQEVSMLGRKCNPNEVYLLKVDDKGSHLEKVGLFMPTDKDANRIITLAKKMLSGKN